MHAVRRMLDDALTKRSDAFAAQSNVPAEAPALRRHQATTGAGIMSVFALVGLVSQQDGARSEARNDTRPDP